MKFSVVLVISIVVLTLANYACGVKGPPLPPERELLANFGASAQPSPSPFPSPSPSPSASPSPGSAKTRTR